MVVLYLDTDTDMTPALAEEYGFKLIPMPYVVDGKEIIPYVSWEEFDDAGFYESLRKGTLPTTNALNPENYKELFEEDFKAGNDIVYVHFSATMTCTFDNMKIAVEELKKKYPQAKFYTADTLGITIGAYTLCLMAAEMCRSGSSAEEIVSAIERERGKYATYFYADKLSFFGRSGRISNMAAFMGNALGIHPILTMNAEGVMTTASKVRGSRQALRALVDYVEKLGDDIKSYPVIISYAGCPELAKQLEGLMKERFGDDLKVTFTKVNPTAGSHCGPDTVGVNFHAVHR